MATTRTATKKTTKQSAPKSAEATVVEEKINEAEVVSDSKPIIPKDIDPYTIVPVYNGFYGKLVYVSPRTGERYVWEEFGDVQEIELRELRNIKSSAKGFYENNWFSFDEEFQWVIPYLGVGQYYKNALGVNEFDELLNEDMDTIITTVNNMSTGQKNSFSYLVRQKVIDGEIDSNKLITALENALNIELVEK